MSSNWVSFRPSEMFGSHFRSGQWRATENPAKANRANALCGVPGPVAIGGWMTQEPLKRYQRSTQRKTPPRIAPPLRERGHGSPDCIGDCRDPLLQRAPGHVADYIPTSLVRLGRAPRNMTPIGRKWRTKLPAIRAGTRRPPSGKNRAPASLSLARLLLLLLFPE